MTGYDFVDNFDQIDELLTTAYFSFIVQGSPSNDEPEIGSYTVPRRPCDSMMLIYAKHLYEIDLPNSFAPHIRDATTSYIESWLEEQGASIHRTKDYVGIAIIGARSFGKTPISLSVYDDSLRFASYVWNIATGKFMKSRSKQHRQIYMPEAVREIQRGK